MSERVSAAVVFAFSTLPGGLLDKAAVSLLLEESGYLQPRRNAFLPTGGAAGSSGSPTPTRRRRPRRAGRAFDIKQKQEQLNGGADEEGDKDKDEDEGEEKKVEENEKADECKVEDIHMVRGENMEEVSHLHLGGIPIIHLDTQRAKSKKEQHVLLKEMQRTGHFSLDGKSKTFAPSGEAAVRAAWKGFCAHQALDGGGLWKVCEPKWSLLARVRLSRRLPDVVLLQALTHRRWVRYLDARLRDALRWYRQGMDGEVRQIFTFYQSQDFFPFFFCRAHGSGSLYNIYIYIYIYIYTHTIICLIT
jgi:hypothetical protein